MRFASGDRLGPFEILAPLGAGGMGEVYRARDSRLDRIVALKVLPTGLVTAPGRRVERFRHEARAVARISHPNICALHDVGEDGSSIFLVMEHVDGQTLAQRLEDGPMPVPLALRVAIGIADALDHAHRHGVVHRDLKPANVMLTRDGVKLLDFGLAKLKERDEEAAREVTKSHYLTEVGTIVGTAAYMSPEQIEGAELDARSDLFSFGVVLFEMLVGRRPFTAESRATLIAAIVAADPPSFSSLHVSTPPALERLIRRCLAKQPDDRWQTARDLAAELRWIGNAGSDATTQDVTSQSRHRGLVGGLAGAAVTALVCAAAAWWMWPTRVVAEYLPVTFRRGVVSSARFAPDGQSVVYSATWEGQPYSAFQMSPAAPAGRDLLLKDARILSISPAGDLAVLIGPQNIEQAFGVRTLARVPLLGGTRRDLLTGIVDADWIPGTDALAVIRDPGGNRNWTVEFPAGETVHEARAAWSLRVSPDGSRVAFFEGPILFGSAPQAQLTVIDRSGHKTTVSRNLTAFGLAWAPSGREIWFTATRPGLAAPHLRGVSLTGVERQIHRAPDWLVLHDISADGRALVSRNTIRISLVCKPRGNARERDLTWLLGSAPRGLSPSGDRLIFEDELGVAPSGNPMLYARGMDGSPPVPIGDGVGAALSPDGTLVLASTGEHFQVFRTGAGEMMTLSIGNLTRVADGAWLGDSKHIVFTGYSDDMPRGYIQEIPAGHPRPITPEGVVLAGKAAVRDESSVLGRAGDAWMLFPIDGGNAPSAPALTPRDIPLQWSHNGKYLYTVGSVEGARRAAVDVFRVAVATGDRTHWRTLEPSDPVGVEDMRETLTITPDAESYCYSYMRRLGDLFVVVGLE
jgi:hypothetical protein